VLIANVVNELGRALDRRGWQRLGDRSYALAAWFDTDWYVPWFNRGIVAKADRNWQECRRFNLRATDLDPSFMPAWWNLGIAATALADWPLARRSWSRYGVTVPPGDGPPDLNLGPVPIRVAPSSSAEVVWCHRIDPARAIIESVPLPDSGRAFGDVLLHDGEPKGHRLLSGREVPVFNELQLLTPSGFLTFQAEVLAPDTEAAAALAMAAVPGSVAIEDWSALRVLCAACSEGAPHDHIEPQRPWESERLFGLAAASEDAAVERLNLWLGAGVGRALRSLECVFARE
jgi:hypothetical protein